MIARMPLFLCLLCAAVAATADANRQVDELAARSTPPHGVVFEIAQRQESALEWALPEIKRHIQTLRARFPEIKFAVVTHGREEFALLSSNAGKYAAVHASVKSLAQDDDVPVHVCGTHASWNDKQPEDFPEYVDVAPAGPAQINDYRALEYEVIVIRRAN